MATKIEVHQIPMPENASPEVREFVEGFNQILRCSGNASCGLLEELLQAVMQSHPVCGAYVIAFAPRDCSHLHTMANVHRDFRGGPGGLAGLLQCTVEHAGDRFGLETETSVAKMPTPHRPKGKDHGPN